VVPALECEAWKWDATVIPPVAVTAVLTSELVTCVDEAARVRGLCVAAVGDVRSMCVFTEL
jgi:hypothetical protein